MTTHSHPVEEPMRVSDVLDRAADLIEPDGAWTQRAFSRNPDGSADLDEDELAASNPVCWCGLGAIAHVTGADPLDPKTFEPTSTRTPRLAVDLLREVVGSDFVDWNDGAERTQPEVVAKLREAAAIAREQDR